MNIIICDDLYLHTVRYTLILLYPLLKSECGTPLVLFTLIFNDVHHIHLHLVYMHTSFFNFVDLPL